MLKRTTIASSSSGRLCAHALIALLPGMSACAGANTPDLASANAAASSPGAEQAAAAEGQSDVPTGREAPEAVSDATTTSADAGEEEVAEEKPVRRRPRQGAWECNGEIDAAKVRVVVGKFLPQVRDCYERRLKVHNTLQGSMMLRVKVGADGSVPATQVGGSLQDPEVFSCVREPARQLEFAAPGRGDCVVIDVPFYLTPQKEGDRKTGTVLGNSESDAIGVGRGR